MPEERSRIGLKTQAHQITNRFIVVICLGAVAACGALVFLSQSGAARAVGIGAATAHPLAEAQQDPIGVGGVVAGFIASLPGAIVIAGLAGAFLGGEWSSRTIAGVLARDPRRVRFVLVKFLSLWCLGIALMLASWVGLIALGPLLRAIYQVPPGPRSFDMGAFTLEQLLRAVVVVGVYASIGTLAAVIARNPLGTFGISFGFVVAGLVAARSTETYPLSLGYWVGSWMGYERATLLDDHVWIDSAAFRGSVAGALAGLVACTLLSVVVAALAMKWSDVR
jgi:hypothetical protein